MASQLSIQERERLSQLVFSGASPAEIARQLGRHRSTVSRELARNSIEGTYLAVRADQIAKKRRRQRPINRKMEDAARREYVVQALVKYWSPEQIAGRAQRMKHYEYGVSHQTIYAWIKAQGEHRSHWESFLRRGGRRRPKQDRRGRIPKQVEIANRPPVVDRRKRLGDWEGDTVLGKVRSGCVVTLVERRSGFLLTAKAQDRQAPRVGRKIVDLMKQLPTSKRKTLTLDNGKEFAEHERVAHKLDVNIYFAQPYCSWQRGTNENTNGLLRQFVPKSTDLRQISHQELKRYNELLNDRPRKRLGFRTPREVFDADKICCI
jgi:transposase, IS30 family